MDTGATINPYSAPTVAEVSTDQPLLYYRNGNLLCFRDGAELPKRCIRTNQEVPDGGWRKQKLITWSPPWILIFILFGFIPFLILSLFLQKKGKITYSLSKEAKGQLWSKRLAFLGMAGIGVLALVGGSMLENDDIEVFIMIVGFLAILIGFLGSFTVTPLAAKKESDGWLSVKGCSEEFLDSIDPTLGKLSL